MAHQGRGGVPVRGYPMQTPQAVPQAQLLQRIEGLERQVAELRLENQRLKAGAGSGGGGASSVPAASGRVVEVRYCCAAESGRSMICERTLANVLTRVSAHVQALLGQGFQMQGDLKVKSQQTAGVQGVQQLFAVTQTMVRKAF